MTRRPQVLVFAYACDPTMGSEPGAGWGVVRALARVADCTVLVGPDHAEGLRQWATRDQGRDLQFAIVDEPGWGQWCPRSRNGRFLRYLGWLRAARRAALRLDLNRFDVTWHVTYSTYWLPAPAATLGLPCVWGPVGGGVTTPVTLWPALGVAGIGHDCLERTAVRLLSWMPATRRTWRQASIA